MSNTKFLKDLQGALDKQGDINLLLAEKLKELYHEVIRLREDVDKLNKKIQIMRVNHDF